MHDWWDLGGLHYPVVVHRINAIDRFVEDEVRHALACENVPFSAIRSNLMLLSNRVRPSLKEAILKGSSTEEIDLLLADLFHELAIPNRSLNFQQHLSEVIREVSDRVFRAPECRLYASMANGFEAMRVRVRNFDLDLVPKGIRSRIGRNQFSDTNINGGRLLTRNSLEQISIDELFDTDLLAVAIAESEIGISKRQAIRVFFAVCDALDKELSNSCRFVERHNAQMKSYLYL